MTSGIERAVGLGIAVMVAAEIVLGIAVEFLLAW